VSLARNLKNHISTAFFEVIRLLENLMLSGSEENCEKRKERVQHLNVYPLVTTDRKQINPGKQKHYGDQTK